VPVGVHAPERPFGDSAMSVTYKPLGVKIVVERPMGDGEAGQFVRGLDRGACTRFKQARHRNCFVGSMEACQDGFAAQAAAA